MRIIAFDLGSTWAAAYHMVDGSTRVEHGVLKGTRVEKLAHFLDDIGYFDEFDVAIYERPFARGQAATRMLWGMAGIIEARAGKCCAVLDATPAEIKKWATGQGNATKDMMGIAAALTLGYTGDNEHEADAWCLLKFAEATLTIGSV